MLSGFILATLIAFTSYLLVSGAYDAEALFFGFIISLATAFITLPLLKDISWKFLNPLRWLYSLVLMTKYFIYYEIKAHALVIKLILRGDLRPAIVRVNYSLRNNFGIATLANLITNTPGTLAIDINDGRKALYIHWIRAESYDDDRAYEEIAKPFEKYLINIFE